MAERELNLVEALRVRLERERKARRDAESIAERATRELYALSRVKTEFLATVSHELRTPLTAIMGFTEILKRELDAHKELRADYLERISKHARRLSRLVDRLLEAARLQAGQGSADHRQFDFAELAEGVIGDIDLQGAVVKIAVPKDLPQLASDPEVIRQVLTHLLENAVKFSPPGGTCTIGAGRDGNILKFWVQDDGIGLAPEDVEHAFEPFWQADSTDARRFAGVGLGLYLVKLLVEMVNGRLEIESSSGSGTKVTVVILWNSSEARAAGA